MIKKTLTLLGLVATTFALQSCFDKDYDLDNIDKTVSVNTDLTVRVGSLDTIRLRNVMDLEPDGVVQFVSDGIAGSEDSIFAIIQDGEADIAPIKIEEVKINPQIGDIETIVNLKELMGGGSSAPRRKARNITIQIDNPMGGGKIPFTFDLDKINQDFHYEITAGSAQNIIDADNDKSKAEINSDVIEIVEVSFKENTKLTINMRTTGFTNWMPKLKLTDLSLTVPTALKLKNFTLKAYQDGKLETISSSSNITSNVLPLTDANGQYVDTNKDITLTITIDGAVKDNKSLKFDPATHKVSFGGVFEVGGIFEMGTKDIDEAKLQTYLSSLSSEKIAEVYNNGEVTLLPIMPTFISFTGNADFGTQGIVLKNFKGKLQHEIGDIDPLKLDDMPDFLDDPSVNLELDNPILLLCAKQGINIPVEINSLKLTATTESGTQIAVTKKIDNILGNSVANYFYIADKELSAEDKAILVAKYPEYANVKRIELQSGSVKALIEKIPDEVEIEVSPVKLDTKTEFVDITKEYDVDIEYKVFAPMKLGSNFTLVYDDEETGWAEDLEDLEDLDLDSLNFSAKAISNMPADIVLTLVPIAEDKSTINQLIVTSIDVKAMANNQDVKFVFKPAPGYTINDVLAGNDKKGVKKLDGVKYKAEIKGNSNYDGKAMPQDAYIILNDLRVSIKGNIVYDAN